MSMLGVAALSCMSPMNSIANPVVFVSITIAPQKFSMVISLNPLALRVLATIFSGLLATGSTLICPCLKLEVPIINEAVGTVAALRNE